MASAELKEQALLEAMGNIVTQYEEKIATLRVELTEVINALNDAHRTIESLQHPPMSVVLDGEVIEG